MISRSMKIRNSLLLVLTALIWGVAFVAQSKGGDAVGALSFNCIRSIIAGIVLLPVIKLLDALGYGSKKPATSQEKKTLVTGGICCGLALFLASTAQQIGITMGTEPGKAGFLTACYILLVPVFGLFLKKKCGFNIWIGVVIAVVGLYFLCMNGSISFETSDLMTLLCAVLFSFHILIIDHFSPLVDGVRMSCIQFFTCGIVGVIPMFIFDMGHSISGISEWLTLFADADAWIAILYAGVMSSGVGYTLQIVGQNGINPTVASMLMSLESVFSVLAGVVILKQFLTVRETVGCVLIFAAIIIAQLPAGKVKAENVNEEQGQADL